MDMGGMNMSAMPSSTGMGMGNHTMGGMHMGDSCKMSMYWNWYTVGTCFLAKSWHVTSSGMFAGSCIGVICLVISLEFLRRAGREYDSFIVRKARLRQSSSGALLGNNTCDNACPAENDTVTPVDTRKQATSASANASARCSTPYRPSLIEHAIRSLLHMVQFAVAYFVMLMAMYYNGYIIICIFIGAFLGAFIFAWEPVDLTKETDATTVTKCCG